MTSVGRLKHNEQIRAALLAGDRVVDIAGRFSCSQGHVYGLMTTEIRATRGLHAVPRQNTLVSILHVLSCLMYETWTLEAIAEECDVSRDSVKAIQAHALEQGIELIPRKVGRPKREV